MKKQTWGAYSSMGDMTFVLEETYNENDEIISTECVGFYYGEPTDEDNKYFKGKLKAEFTWNVQQERNNKTMKKSYNIPYYSMNEGNNKNTIKKAITLLSNDYLVNFAFIEDQRRIELLETIVNLTNIYFNMSIEE